MPTRRKVLLTSMQVGIASKILVGGSQGYDQNRKWQEVVKLAEDDYSEIDTLADVKLENNMRLLLPVIEDVEGTIFYTDSPWHDSDSLWHEDQTNLYLVSYNEIPREDPLEGYMEPSTLHAIGSDSQLWGREFDHPVAAIEDLDQDHLLVFTIDSSLHLVQKSDGVVVNTEEVMDNKEYRDIFNRHFTGIEILDFKIKSNSVYLSFSVGHGDDSEKVGRIFKISDGNIIEVAQELGRLDGDGERYWITQSGPTIYKYSTKHDSLNELTSRLSEKHRSVANGNGVAFYIRSSPYYDAPNNIIYIADHKHGSGNTIRHSEDEISNVYTTEDVFVIEAHDVEEVEEDVMMPDHPDHGEPNPTRPTDIYLQGYSVSGDLLWDEHYSNGDNFENFEIETGNEKIFVELGDSVECIDPTTGRKIWSKTGIDEYEILDSDNLVVSSSDGTKSIIMSENGSELWKGDPITIEEYLSDEEIGNLLIIHADGSMNFINLHDGSLIRSVDYFADEINLEFHRCESGELHIADMENDVIFQLSENEVEVYPDNEGPLCKEHAMVYDESIGRLIVDMTDDPTTMNLKDNFVNSIDQFELDVTAPSSDANRYDRLYESENGMFYIFSTSDHQRSIITNIKLAKIVPDSEISDEQNDEINEPEEDTADSAPGMGIAAGLGALVTSAIILKRNNNNSEK